jgi:hypothetical protein
MTRIRDALLNLVLMSVAIPFLAFFAVYGMIYILFHRDTKDPFDIYPPGHPLSR